MRLDLPKELPLPACSHQVSLRFVKQGLSSGPAGWARYARCRHASQKKRGAAGVDQETLAGAAEEARDGGQDNERSSAEAMRRCSVAAPGESSRDQR